MEKLTEMLRINHKGMDLGLVATVEFLNNFQRWIQSKKKFRVTLDYDPEWAAIVRFRLLDENEAAEMDKLNPTLQNSSRLSCPQPCRNQES